MATESELAADLEQAARWLRDKYGHLIGRIDFNVLPRRGHELDGLIKEAETLAAMIRDKVSSIPPWAQ